MSQATFSSANALTGYPEPLPGYFGHNVRPEIANIMRRAQAATSKLQPLAMERKTKRTGSPELTRENAALIESALQDVIEEQARLSEATARLQTIADEIARDDEIIDLSPDWIVDAKSPFFASVARNIHAKMPSREQMANARQRALGWVRTNGPMLFATCSASAAMGYFAPQLLAKFRLNALIATVPFFSEAMAAKAMVATTGAFVGLTAPTMELIAKAMRPAHRKSVKTKDYAAKAGRSALLSATTRTLLGTFGPLTSLVTLLGETIAKTGTFVVSRALGLKKKEPIPFDKKAFSIRLGLSLLSAGISALVGYHLRFHADASDAVVAAPEPHAPQPAAQVETTSAPAHVQPAAPAVHEPSAAQPVAETPAPRNELDRERLASAPKHAPSELDRERAADAVHHYELPPVKMPTSYASLMTVDQFHSLPRDLQETAVIAASKGNPVTFMHVAKEASYHLLQEGNAKASKSAGKLIEKALNVAFEHGLLDTETGRKLNADMAYLLATGKGGVTRDFTKAAYHMCLGGGTKTAGDVEGILQARAPQTLAAARADYVRFRKEDLGLG